MKAIVAIVIVAVILIILVTIGGTKEFTDAKLDVPEIKVNSSSINEEGKLFTAVAAEQKNSPAGSNQSPAVSWEAVEGANYYAVCMFDESANWLHLLVTDIKDTSIPQGFYIQRSFYVGPYPPKASGTHVYRIEVFAIKKQPKDTIGKLDSKMSYKNLVNHLNQVGGDSDNIIARGHITGSYEYGDFTVSE